MVRPLVLALAGLFAGGAAVAGASGDRPVSDAGEPEQSVMSRGVTGRVLDASGQPVAGAMIVARSLDVPARPVPEIAVLSGPDGRFAWPLQPGRYALSATIEGRAGTAVTVQVRGEGAVQADLSAP